MKRPFLVFYHKLSRYLPLFRELSWRNISINRMNFNACMMIAINKKESIQLNTLFFI